MSDKKPAQSEVSYWRCFCEWWSPKKMVKPLKCPKCGLSSTWIRKSTGKVAWVRRPKK